MRYNNDKVKLRRWL